MKPRLFLAMVVVLGHLSAQALAADPAGAAPPAAVKPGPAASAPASAGKPAATTPAKPKSATSPSKPGAAKATTAKPGRPLQKPGEVLDVDWRDLLPLEERPRYSASAPPPIHGPLGEGGPPAVQKITTTVNADLVGMNVRLPGFVVPIGAPRNGLITEFFLVPYIGACIHVPPPPSNQMVYVTTASGVPEASVHEAYWVTGKIRLDNRTTPLGTAAYALSAGKVELYQY